MSDSNTSLASGLDAIFNVASDSQESRVSQQQDSYPLAIPVTDLQPSTYQPRTLFDTEDLKELAQSISENGIIQPVLVRKIENGYEIIAGERRWRAAKMLDLPTVPVIVKDINNETALAFALIENIQRKDLNVIEEARAYQRLLNELKFSHDEIASRVGKSRPHITNLLRLLNLSPHIHSYLERGLITMGHARAILALSEEQQLEIADKVIKHSLSVRKAERMAKQINAPSITKDHELTFPLKQKLREWKSQLSGSLPNKTNIDIDSRGKGRLVIHFKSIEEADALVAELIDRPKEKVR